MQPSRVEHGTASPAVPAAITNMTISRMSSNTCRVLVGAAMGRHQRTTGTPRSVAILTIPERLTLSKVILYLEKPRGRDGRITTASLYVGLTRVRRNEGMRVLSLSPGSSLDHLLELRRDVTLQHWYATVTKTRGTSITGLQHTTFKLKFTLVQPQHKQDGGQHPSERK